MPLAAVMSVNFAAGTSAVVRFAVAGAESGVSLGNGASALCFSFQITPQAIAAISSTARADPFTARPLTLSSAWTCSSDSSTGPGVGLWLMENPGRRNGHRSGRHRRHREAEQRRCVEHSLVARDQWP